MLNAFADKDDNLEIPASDWDPTSSKQRGTTNVNIIYHDSPESLENMLEMGFPGGFTMTLNYLENLLTTLSRRQ
jgi:hypothetical protein